MTRISPYIPDALLIVLFVLLPGIRGYGDWAWYEYLLLAFILAYILYLRYRLRRK